MSNGRMHLLDDIHFVTNRCFQERLLMLPNDAVNFIIGYWFARALEKFGDGLQIYAFIFLSNHFHALIKDTKGTLAEFMGYFQANVAKAVNRLLGRRGAFWQGHYDDQIVVDDVSFWEKFTYINCNAVKAGLVDQSEEWIGWSSLEKSLKGGTFSFTAINRDRCNKASRNRKKRPDPKQFEETYSFELTPPLGYEDKSTEECAAHILPLIRKQEAFHRDLRENKPPLGIEAIKHQRPTDRPLSPSRTRKRRRFACKDEKRLQERLEQYRDFIAIYRETVFQFQRAVAAGKRFHNEWPVGCYPPSAKLVTAA